MKLYAFWEYSSFPYVLGGTVTKIHDSGHVSTKEHGRGYSFKPIKIVPLKEGLRIKAQLDELKANYFKAKKEFDATWDENLKRATGLL